MARDDDLLDDEFTGFTAGGGHDSARLLAGPVVASEFGDCTRLSSYMRLSIDRPDWDLLSDEE
jgi:hypothetical protein